jgi:hypothetical protein
MRFRPTLLAALFTATAFQLLLVPSVRASCGDWLAHNSLVANPREITGQRPAPIPRVPSCRGPNCHQAPDPLPLNEHRTTVVQQRWLFASLADDLRTSHCSWRVAPSGHQRPLAGYCLRIDRPPKS